MHFSRRAQMNGRMFRNGGFMTRNAMVAALAASALLPVGQAHAANTLFDLFRSHRQQTDSSFPPPPPAPVAPRTGAVPRIAATPRVIVKGPQVDYDYKPEALVKIDFSGLDLQVTAATGQQPAPANPLIPGAAPASQPDEAGTPGDRAFNAAMDDLKAVDVKAEKPIADAIVSFYSTHRSFIWSADDKVLDKAKAVAAFFARAGEDGLNPDEYAVTIPSDGFDPQQIDARRRKLAEFEIRMSARALRYAMDAGEGRIIADRLGGFYDLPRGRVDPKRVLEQLATQSDPVAYLHSFEPDSPQYTELKQQLAATPAPSTEPVRVSLNGVIRPGDSSDQLGKIVALISANAPADYLEQHRDVLAAHADANTYDPELVSAIKDYQKLSGSAPDGVIGKNTVAALQGADESANRDRILYSMERLRWLPHDMGKRFVLVNPAAYHAGYYEDGKEKLGMRVVVGSPTHQTYFFYNKVQTVVFNPYWGVPRSIILNEMLPKVMRDNSYLDRNGYELYQDGRKVSASEVNWNAVAAGRQQVSIRQKPSLDNALGELKILFPNSHDIYMHDTPAKSYFKRDARALSHGCIRLERPRDMAAALLEQPVESLNKYFGGNERGVKVPEPVPVYIGYFTAWPDNDGRIHYYGDVYGRDAGMQKAFEKTVDSRLAAS
ncbi:MAG: L,D-transpeptidase family protein [Rhizobiales bacterium]|nr:L,D-transpeptidase family protein [Hyphomicrobiales bacterium]OJX99250.1 MAG: peptidoglycan-binding protein [Rhizobiales bacterium 63-22]